MNKSEGLARWLIQRAARTAPPLLSERLEEEWLADLEARRGAIERLRLAAGCCWATKVIAHEHCVASVAAAATATGSKTMSAYMQHDEVYFSRRSIAMLAIITLHVGIVWAFATGLGHTVVSKWNGGFEVMPMPDPTTHRDPPPLPRTDVDFRRTVDIPTPDLPNDYPVDSDHTLTVVQDPVITPPGPTITVPPAVKRVGGGPGKGFPHTEDYYPPDAIRKGQEGATTVRSCVDERGMLTAMPTVTQPSGTASLDEGALRLAKEASGHYRPTTEDGRAVRSCFDFRVTFQLVHR